MAEESQQLRTVLLRHELPDGSGHFDWMIERSEAGESLLQTFRCDRRVDELKEGQAMELEEIGDHRRAYLEYEGPVSGGRGEVRRVRRGIVERCEDPSGELAIVIWWEAGSGPGSKQTLMMRCGRSGRWVVRAGGTHGVNMRE